jgi:hypothetical protein
MPMKVKKLKHNRRKPKKLAIKQVKAAIKAQQENDNTTKSWREFLTLERMKMALKILKKGDWLAALIFWLRDRGLYRFCENFNSICIFAFLCIVSQYALADAFLPTMISANVLWVVALPLVVVIEGWFMTRQKWNSPYKNSLLGNLLSMLAAIPLGIALSSIGLFIGRLDLSAFGATVELIRRFSIQVFLYGDLQSPSYGYVSGFNMAGVVLAAIIFMGICWLFSIIIEGIYYGKKNPEVPKAVIFRVTTTSHFISYCILFAVWFPYSYSVAKSTEDRSKHFCERPNIWLSNCPEIFEKFPEAKKVRLDACSKQGIIEELCMSGRIN